ncbi:siderophore-interacting protein [Paracoccus caeni]|uniref:Siderophore-interacting protein n=1 Tax=Paracoccus caeni TaxID=657651 RepID=A0A934W1K7_9RHOB|nr:siderophore-interacting protein [Paracoccus caeni]MBK4217473.1 siderophore-interacting protein [Paracoccus caeni]
MSQLRTYRNLGVIPRASGAAVAALKARATAWDVPLVESPEALSLFVWGCELRLTPEDGSVRVDLAAPEARLMGNLQDSATELFAEAGLEILWERVDEGALAPGLSLMRVVSVSPRTPGYLRVRLQGPEAARFGQGSLHFRLLVPPAGRQAIWPRIGATGRTIWPEGPDALHRPVYTVIEQQDDWLDFDIFRHEGSPTCDWALSGPEGAEVAIIGPGGGWCPDAARLHLFGDETALPAIVRMLELATCEVEAFVSASYPDLGPLAADPRVKKVDDLLAALQDCGTGEGSFVWFAAEAGQARKARSHLQARGIDKRNFMAAAYWG